MSNLPSVFNRNSFTGNPMRDLLRMQRRMDRFAPNLMDEMWNPSCDVEETDTHYLMSFDLPGVKKDDINIDLRDDLLTVSGERNEERDEKSGQKYQSERFWGAFTRSFQIPAGVKPDQVEAHYADGVLRIAVPKVEAAKAPQIKISEGKTGFWERLLGHKKEETPGNARGNVKTSTESESRFQIKAG